MLNKHLIVYIKTYFPDHLLHLLSLTNKYLGKNIKVAFNRRQLNKQSVIDFFKVLVYAKSTIRIIRYLFGIFEIHIYQKSFAFFYLGLVPQYEKLAEDSFLLQPISSYLFANISEYIILNLLKIKKYKLIMFLFQHKKIQAHEMFELGLEVGQMNICQRFQSANIYQDINYYELMSDIIHENCFSYLQYLYEGRTSRVVFDKIPKVENMEIAVKYKTRIEFHDMYLFLRNHNFSFAYSIVENFINNKTDYIFYLIDYILEIADSEDIQLLNFLFGKHPNLYSDEDLFQQLMNSNNIDLINHFSKRFNFNHSVEISYRKLPPSKITITEKFAKDIEKLGFNFENPIVIRNNMSIDFLEYFFEKGYSFSIDYYTLYTVTEDMFSFICKYKNHPKIEELISKINNQFNSISHFLCHTYNFELFLSCGFHLTQHILKVNIQQRNYSILKFVTLSKKDMNKPIFQKYKKEINFCFGKTIIY